MTSAAPTLPLRTLALVDSDSEDAQIFQLMLRKAGIELPLQVYQRAEEFIAAFTKLVKKSALALPLICFLDLTLPDVQGLDLARWIRSDPRFDAMSLVILSASDNPEDVRAASAAGAQCYLHKYPQPDLLRRLVNEATELSKQRPANHWFGLTENLILRWTPSQGTAFG